MKLNIVDNCVSSEGPKTEIKSFYYGVWTYYIPRSAVGVGSYLSVAVMLMYLPNNLLFACVCLSLAWVQHHVIIVGWLNMCNVVSYSSVACCEHRFPQCREQKEVSE